MMPTALRFSVPIAIVVLAGRMPHAHAQAAFAAPAPEPSRVQRDAAESPPAPAQPEPSLPAPALRVDLGVFSPVGAIGVVYSRPLHRLAAIELGVGHGFSGVQASAMAKLRAGNERTSFTPGIGLSAGLPILGTSAVHSGHPNNDTDAPGAPVTMLWLDVDALGIEHRTRGGLVLSATAGLTVALTRGHWDAIDLGGNIDRGQMLPQCRVGLGKVFD